MSMERISFSCPIGVSHINLNALMDSLLLPGNRRSLKQKAAGNKNI
jgi:hypothetical protein